jgi:predicted HicB family RNase H-like nuclease
MPKPYQKLITVRKEVWETAQALAQSQGVSVAEYVSQLILKAKESAANV